MNIAIVGTGYVGLVTGSCLAEVGFNVICIDINHEKIETLKQGISPIYEPGLDIIIQRNIKQNRLHFSTELNADIIHNSEIIFSAVGTPADEDGSADLQYVLNVAKTIGQYIDNYTLVVTKSTVPVGTAHQIRTTIQKELANRHIDVDFDIASNPEFLKEGEAVKDFMKPDRIVVGIDSEKAKQLMNKLYHPFVVNVCPLIFTDIASAEMIKYAANAMLATRISFMNEIANLCDLTGADINMVRKGIGADSRIGNKFLYSGIGYGGSCFPKDVKALIKTAHEYNYSLNILKAVEEVNEQQKHILYQKLFKYYNGNLKAKNIALWGLAFKPNTDDMREAPSLTIIENLLQEGAYIHVYDPIAMPETKRRIGEKVHYCKTKNEAVENADALLLITEWVEFRSADILTLKNLMKKQVIFDGRNVFNPKEVKENGFDYFGIGIR